MWCTFNTPLKATGLKVGLKLHMMMENWNPLFCLGFLKLAYLRLIAESQHLCEKSFFSLPLLPFYPSSTVWQLFSLMAKLYWHIQHSWIILIWSVESGWFQLSPVDSGWFQLSPVESGWVWLSPVKSSLVCLSPVESGCTELSRTRSHCVLCTFQYLPKMTNDSTLCSPLNLWRDSWKNSISA